MRRVLQKLSRTALPLSFLALATLTPTAALAQLASPTPTVSRAPAPWIGFLLMAVLLGVIVAVSLMPSKRTHQD